VAILSTEDFDATDVDPSTVALAGASVAVVGKGAGKLLQSIEDVDGDGDLDLIVHVETEFLELVLSDEAAVLTGQTYDGDPIGGSDTVRIVKE
jgi:hypothetical protein